MKTATTHEYHGITLRDDSYGWTIQIRLLGRYRYIKTFANSADIAASRYDAAINKLQAFVEDGTYPNFPGNFPPDVPMPADAPADYNQFRQELHNLFSVLVSELESIGVDYDQRCDERANVFQESLRRAAAKNRNERDQAIAAIQRVVNRLFKITDLTPEQRRLIGGNLEAARKILV